jgi:hypothetical protein
MNDYLLVVLAKDGSIEGCRLPGQGLALAGALRKLATTVEETMVQDAIDMVTIQVVDTDTPTGDLLAERKAEANEVPRQARARTHTSHPTHNRRRRQ